MRYFLFLFALILPIPYQPAAVFATICPNQPDITILSDESETIHRICLGSEKALTALALYGLHPKRQITIEIVQRGIDNHGYLAFGSYDSRLDRIKIMSFDSILLEYENPIMYDEVFDSDHYTGAIAHEITHAVFHHHMHSASPGTAPQEYLAHAIQLSVLPEDRRNRIISKMDVSAWLPGDAISDIYMALEPGRFAVKSYKHLTTTKDPAGFIDILLNSKWFYVYIP